MATKGSRKRSRKAASATEAINTTVLAIADARERGHGINLETTFPGGRIKVCIGEITVTRTSAKDIL